MRPGEDVTVSMWVCSSPVSSPPCYHSQKPTTFPPLTLLSCSTTGCPVGVDAELRSPDWLQVTQENSNCTNDSSRWLVHHSEVMWSGGGLKQSLISVHTITLKQHNCLNKPELALRVRPALITNSWCLHWGYYFHTTFSLCVEVFCSVFSTAAFQCEINTYGEETPTCTAKAKQSKTTVPQKETTRYRLSAPR